MLGCGLKKKKIEQVIPELNLLIFKILIDIVLNDSLNSIGLYDFQNLHIYDFIQSYNPHFFPLRTLLLLLLPFLSPLMSTSFFSVSVSLLLFGFIHQLVLLLDSAYKQYHTYLSFSDQFYLAYCPPSPCMQMIKFHSFLWA